MRMSQQVNLIPHGGEIPNGQFISRFAVNQEANIHASVRVRLVESHKKDTEYPVFLYLVHDEEWEGVLHAKNCSNIAEKAKYTIPQTLKGNGEWSRWASVEDQLLAETTVVYIVITDCLGATHQTDPSLPLIEVDVHILNHGSELSHEDHGLIYLYPLLFIIYLVFLGKQVWDLGKDALNKVEVDAAKVGLIFAIYTEFLYIGCQTVDIFIYAYNGSGFYLLDLSGTFFQMTAQVVIVGLFIMIAYGWKVTDVDIAENNTLVIIGGVVCVMQSGASFLTFIDDGAHHKYHDYGGFQGLLLIAIRVFTWIVFVYGLLQNFGKVNKRAKPLLKALAVAGSLYMMAFPGLWFLCFFVPGYLENRVIVVGNAVVQLFAIIILTNQLTKRGSKFDEASKPSKTVLPSGS